jgi:hypothetical protein
MEKTRVILSKEEISEIFEQIKFSNDPKVLDSKEFTALKSKFEQLVLMG